MSVELKRLYKTLKKLGEGADGSVYMVLSKSTGLKYAMKVINMRSITADDMFTEDFPLEAKMMVDLSGVDGVVQLQHVFREKPLRYGNVKMDDSFVLVMSIPPTAYSMLGSGKIKYKSQLRVVFSKLASILRKVDDHNISHMDLHDGNVLVEDKSLNVTLIDFGRAQYKTRPYALIEALRRWKQSPPELVEDGVFDYDMITVWLFGRMMYEMFVSDDTSTYPDVTRVNWMPPLLQKLLSKVFVPYENRIGLRQMFDDKYFDLSVADLVVFAGGDLLVRKPLGR